MTKPPAKAEVPHRSGASSILVWNGLVTRMRRIGGENRSRAHVDVDSSLERRREAETRGTGKTLTSRRPLPIADAETRGRGRSLSRIRDQRDARPRPRPVPNSAAPHPGSPGRGARRGTGSGSDRRSFRGRHRSGCVSTTPSGCSSGGDHRDLGVRQCSERYSPVSRDHVPPTVTHSARSSHRAPAGTSEATPDSRSVLQRSQPGQRLPGVPVP